jgi:flagellar biosynthesis regulator FlaF
MVVLLCETAIALISVVLWLLNEYEDIGQGEVMERDYKILVLKYQAPVI